MVELAAQFVRRDLEVDLVLARARGPHLQAVPDPVHVVDLSASRTLFSLPGLAGYLRRREPEVLLATLAHANVMAVIARRLAGTRTRVVLRETNSPKVAARQARRVREALLPAFIRIFYRWADGWIANSEATAADLAGIASLDRSEIRVLPNPVDVERVRRLARQPAPHPWFEQDTPLVLGAGRLHPQKDYVALIDAFVHFRASMEARLVILGEGRERDRLEERAKASGYGADIALPGYVENPYACMARASVFATSSRFEGFGNVLVEAMAVGTPVVALRDSGGPPEILDHGAYGRLVPAGDPAALADALAEAIVDATDSGRLQARADVFSADVVSDRYLEVLKGQNDRLEHGPPGNERQQ